MFEHKLAYVTSQLRNRISCEANRERNREACNVRNNTFKKVMFPPERRPKTKMSTFVYGSPLHAYQVADTVNLLCSS